jgi:hypothetical protein
MNKRIRLLAQQAEMFANKGDRVDVKIMMENFAELIIEECAKRAEAYAYMSPNFTALAEELRSMKGVE